MLIAEPREEPAAIARDYLAAWGVETQRAVSEEGARERALAAARAGRPFDVAMVGIGAPARAAEVAAGLRSLEGCGEMALVLVKDVGAPAAEPHGPFERELTRPLKQSQLHAAVLAAGAVGGAAGTEPPAPALPAGLRVLVAEDNEVNRALMVRQLAKLGVTADAAASGREAVDAVSARAYDAVLMDFYMPEMDGLEAARAIRALPGARGAMPIVAVTAGGTPEERGACLAAGMSGFLRKPASSRDLARALAPVLPGPGAPAAGAEDALPAAPAIDPAAIERLDADLGDRSELRRIAGIYVEQLEAGARTIAAAAAAGDGDGLRRAAHRLGSASATFGAGAVAELCHRIEALGAADRAASAAEQVRRLEEQSARAAGELRALLELD